MGVQCGNRLWEYSEGVDCGSTVLEDTAGVQ